jgi:hypothetical protein
LVDGDHGGEGPSLNFYGRDAAKVEGVDGGVISGWIPGEGRFPLRSTEYEQISQFFRRPVALLYSQQAVSSSQFLERTLSRVN